MTWQQETIGTDIARPRFHFTAPRGWINDPHGITVKNGIYHRFYQYVPESATWAPNCHWGHSRGSDLFTFEPLPVALEPGSDDEGIWTGCLVVNGGDVRIFYTSVGLPEFGIGRVRIAVPEDDEWITWGKGEFVVHAPPELDLVAFRDPFVIQESTGWRMFVGAGLTDGTASALSYTSTDLQRWEYDGVALQRSTHQTEPVWMGSLWECPQIIELDGRHVMISSVWDDDQLYYAGYAIGTYQNGQFDAESWGQLTHGPSYYAPSFHQDAEGHPCLTFWMRGIQAPDQSWVGAHSVPHVLSLNGDTLVATPHPDIERYHGANAVDGGLAGSAGDIMWLPGCELVIRGADGPAVTISVGPTALTVTNGAETWPMPYNGGSVRVIIDGPVLELSTKAGVLGIAIVPQTSYSLISDGRLTVAPLRR